MDESPVDTQSERMTVTITDSEGNKTEKERAVFFSVRTYNKIANMMAYPYGSVQDDVKRKELCIQLWGEIQAAVATIGRRTLTSVMTDILERSPTTAAATAAVAAQGRKKPAATSTPGKKPSVAAGSSSSSKRMLNPLTQRPKRASADPRDCSQHRPCSQRHLPARPVFQLVQGGQVQVLRPERVQLRAQGPAQGQVPERSHDTARPLGGSGFGLKTRCYEARPHASVHCASLPTLTNSVQQFICREGSVSLCGRAVVAPGIPYTNCLGLRGGERGFLRSPPACGESCRSLARWNPRQGMFEENLMKRVLLAGHSREHVFRS